MTGDLQPYSGPSIPAMSIRAIENVRRLEARILAGPQVAIATDHVFHAGLYLRTIVMPARLALTGALIKKASTLILSGDADIYLDGEARRFRGYHILTASAGRKQAFFTHRKTTLTMICATTARTVEDVERELTDEVETLGSHYNANRIKITEA